jgi:glycosyltransferase involved in cell wall biosynthesis
MPIKPRIVYVNSTGEWLGGAEVSLYDLMMNIDRKQFEPILVVPFWGEFANTVASQGIQVINLKGSKFPSFSFHILGKKIYNPLALCYFAMQIVILSYRLRRVLDSIEKPLIVHGNSFSANFFGALACWRKFPFIAHLRDLGPRKGLSALIYVALTRLIPIRIAVKTISISGAVARRFGIEEASLIRHDPITLGKVGNNYIAYNPVKVKLAGKDGLSFRPFTIGLVGRILPWKGHLTALRILDEVRQRTEKRVRLAIVGDLGKADQSYLAHIYRMIQKMELKDSVFFWGFRRDPDEIYENLDVLIVPSEEEPLGRVVLEGMAYGVPVIATDKGGPAEIIEDGVDGFLVSPDDVHRWAERIIELMENPTLASEIGRRGRQKVLSNFSIENYIESIESLYKEILTTWEWK